MLQWATNRPDAVLMIHQFDICGVLIYGREEGGQISKEQRLRWSNPSLTVPAHRKCLVWQLAPKHPIMIIHTHILSFVLVK